MINLIGGTGLWLVVESSNEIVSTVQAAEKKHGYLFWAREDFDTIKEKDLI